MKKTLLATCCLLFVHQQIKAQTWDTLANVPKALSFPVVVALNNEIHVIGGGATGGASNIHLRYKPGTNVWDTLAPVPYLAQQPAGAVLNGKIHYFGGGYPNSGTPLASHYAYDPISNSWTSMAALPIPRVIMEAGVINGKLYALTGQPNKTRVDEYDPGTNTWTSKNPLPDQNFWYSALVVHNNEMYRFGGGGYIAPVTSVHKYDSISDAWTSIATLPVALHAPAGASMYGSIYIGGGYSGAETNAVRAFDANNFTFNNVTSLPVARSYHEIVSIDNCIYSVGGNNNSVPGVNTSLLRYCKPLVTGNTINENKAVEFISVFPNPVSNRVCIKGQKNMKRIEMFDVAGKLVYSCEPASPLAEIDMSSIDRGVYILYCYTEGNVDHRRIIKD